MSAADAELAHSQTGSEGGLTLSLPVQAPPKEQLLVNNAGKISNDDTIMMRQGVASQAIDLIGSGSVDILEKRDL